MRMPVSELAERMPSSEFTHWMAYMQDHLLADEAIPWLLAQLLANLHNMFSRQGTQDVKAEDLLRPRRKKINPQAVLANFMNYNAFYEANRRGK